jgi:TPP-dependent pyruvate/acetoin dehydrogenase alpha subunit
VLYVVENNRIAQTTPPELALAGSLRGRFEAFGIPVSELDSSDVRQIHALAGKEMAALRSAGRPRALVLHTCRFGPHSKGDDTRPAEEVAQMRAQREPLSIQSSRLGEAEKWGIEQEVEAEVEIAFRQALNDPFPVMGV